MSWTKNLCANMSSAKDAAEGSSSNSESGETVGDLSTWSVLDVGTGNGLLLQELAKQGYFFHSSCPCIFPYLFASCLFTF